jgi:hypothetical protein
MKVSRSFNPTNRYYFDFKKCTIKNGFGQIDTDQDAWYFGTWANPTEFLIVNYAEGDVTIQEAENEKEFKNAIIELKTWNEENGFKFIGIDPGFNESLKNQFIDIGLGEFLH